MLDASGQPRVRVVAGGVRAAASRRPARARRRCSRSRRRPHPYTRAFAVKGLGALKDRVGGPGAAAAPARARDAGVRSRRFARSDASATRRPRRRCCGIAQGRTRRRRLRLEAVTALGGVRRGRRRPTRCIDLLSRSRVRRFARRRCARAPPLDPDGFVTILSGLDPDPDWRVRAALAVDARHAAAADAACRGSTSMLSDSDQRVIAAVLTALVKLERARTSGVILLDHLKADDPVVRAAAASGLGELQAAGRRAGAAGRVSVRSARRDVRRRARPRSPRFAKYGIASARSAARRGARRQGLGGARARGHAAQAGRSGERRRRADSAGAARSSPPDTYQAPRLVDAAGVARRPSSTPTAARSRSSWPCSTRR